jgi:hypothetical protein
MVKKAVSLQQIFYLSKFSRSPLTKLVGHQQVNFVNHEQDMRKENSNLLLQHETIKDIYSENLRCYKLQEPFEI